MARNPKVMDFTVKAMNVLHNGLHKLSGGRFGRKLLGMPAVVLHTTGRKSGKAHNIWLTSPIHDEGRVVLIASKGGDDRNPDWYLNLMAQPDTTLELDGETRKIHARTATPEEKAVLWPQVIKAYKGYAGYQKHTNRDIPVVICEFQ